MRALSRQKRSGFQKYENSSGHVRCHRWLQLRASHSQFAQKIFLDVANEKYAGCITAKSITDIYYLMHKFLHDDKKTRTELKKLFFLFEVIDTFGADCVSAVNSELSDYEDAVMSETAQRNGLDYIVTRNLRDYSKSKVKVVSPERFLNLTELL